MLVFGLMFLVIVGWCGLVFARSYANLKVDSVALAQESSNLSIYMFENGWMKEVSNIESFRGMLINKGKCLRLWDGNLMRCFEWSDQTLGLVYMNDDGSWMGRQSIGALVEGGWIGKQGLVSTNEESFEAYVSDPDKVGIDEVMRILRFGDIVRVVINVDTREVVGVVMVQRGGLI